MTTSITKTYNINVEIPFNVSIYDDDRGTLFIKTGDLEIVRQMLIDIIAMIDTAMDNE